MRTASRAAPSSPSASLRCVPQKPHAPSTSTRTPTPPSSNWVTLLTRPFLTVIVCDGALHDAAVGVPGARRVGGVEHALRDVTHPAALTRSS